MKKDITLSDEQKKTVIDQWKNGKTPMIKDLIVAAFPNLDEKFYDGRSNYGRAVKAYLAEKGLEAGVTSKYVKKTFSLTEEQKEFIYNNCSTMKALEMTRELFGFKVSPLDQKHKEVKKYLSTIDNKVIFSDVIKEDTEPQDYTPPKTEQKAITKINKYVHDGLDKNNLKSIEKKCIAKLIGYMHTYRFIHQISTYTAVKNKDLFESSFVRYTYDKPDLTQEEVDQYITLSAEMVIGANIQVRVERLQELLDQCAEETDGKKIAMSLTESIGTAQTEYNQCINRQTKLLNELKEKRSQRLSKEIKENASILNLVEMWKEEESRVKMIKLAELRKNSLKEEMERLSTLDEIKCRIMGLTEEEVLNG